MKTMLTSDHVVVDSVGAIAALIAGIFFFLSGFHQGFLSAVVFSVYIGVVFSLMASFVLIFNMEKSN